MSTPLSQFLGSSGGTPHGLVEKIFLTSGSFTAPIDGNFLLTAIGGGGGGGGKASTPSQTAGGGGGGAGGFCQKLVYLSAGTTINFTVGARGVRAGVSTTNDATGGGTTTITVGSHTLTANGGAAQSVHNQPVGEYQPAPGGTASGGDLNFTGGSGSGFVYSTAGGGGGAVALYGTGYSAHVAQALGAQAGVGGSPSDTGWPGTAMVDGYTAERLSYTSASASASTNYGSYSTYIPATYEIYQGGMTQVGGRLVPGNRRFLEPDGGITFYGPSPVFMLIGPGSGSRAISGTTIYGGAAFAGASGGYINSGGLSQSLGGGGGGGSSGTTTTAAGGYGGSGVVVIEYIMPTI